MRRKGSSVMKKISNPPKSENLFRAAQSQGSYTLAAALADIIDNSISAGASEICVHLSVERTTEDTAVVIADNGSGMTAEELIEAMRPASKNANEDREKNDLGRFGWGLKSASLSQAERLEVVSKKNQERTFASWDLADCQNFEMELDQNTDVSPELAREEHDSWTEVRWKKCARLTEGYALQQRQMVDKISEAVLELELTFHRFLDGQEGYPPISIRVNGRPLRSHDPFLRSKSTLLTDVTPIPFRDGSFSYEAYALPRLNVMSEEEHSRLAGDEGLVKRQGFYVYRNRRLIISGTWFNIEPYRPLNQLIRIKLDIPNNMDDIWRITVDKANAQLPQDLKVYLRSIVKSLRPHSTKKLTAGTFRRKANDKSFWRLTRKSGVQALEINRDATIFQKESFSRKEVLNLVTLIQASLPIDLIARNKPENFSQIELEREAAGEIYSAVLEILASTVQDLSEGEFVKEAMRYVLMPGDEEMMKRIATEKYSEL